MEHKQKKITQPVNYMVAMAMSLSDRLSLAGLGTTGSSISNLDILDMVPFWNSKIKTKFLHIS